MFGVDWKAVAGLLVIADLKMIGATVFALFSPYQLKHLEMARWLGFPAGM